MVTIQDAVQYVNGVACTTKKVWCKSTDVKPTEGIGNGSQLREMDTGKDYAFDAENGEWLEQPEEGGGGGGGSSTLSGLTDVDISNPTDGQTLVYNATAQKWENGAGGGGVMVVHVDAQTGVFDKTWQEIHDAAITRGAIIVGEFTDYGVTDTRSIWVARCVADPDPIEGSPTWDVFDNIDDFHAYASSANGYPVLD